ncbi:MULTISPECIES: ABC transporter permease [Corynebacterium]|uniref:ABC transporter permease n=1 Tax=Corynebacterium TaxID=1716 RepID=UPI00124EA2B6|nr:MULTISPECIES: ABC transporter permease [Corynebacterium]
MTSTRIHRPLEATPRPFGAIASIWKRDMLRLLRNQAAMISSIMIPSIFMLAFYASFARSAEHFMDSYADFILPSAVTQAIIFTAGGSCLAVAEDKEDGFYSRLLSMPVPSWSIVAGRLLADLTRMTWSGAIPLALAFLLGARFHGGIGAAALFLLALALITVVLSAAIDGLVLITAHPVSTALTFQGLTIAILLLSTAFVPADALPGHVGTVVARIPLSPILDSLRALAAAEPLGSTGVEAAVWLVVLSAAGFWGFSTALRRGHVS